MFRAARGSGFIDVRRAVFFWMTIACGRTTLHDLPTSTSSASGAASNAGNASTAGGAGGTGNVTTGGSYRSGGASFGAAPGFGSSGGTSGSSGGSVTSYGGTGSGGATPGGAGNANGGGSFAGTASTMAGAAGLACSSKQGACTVSGQLKCVNLWDDPANCGTCGRRCASDEHCKSAACVKLAPCAAPMKFGSPRSPTGLSGELSLATADFDADGRLDVFSMSTTLGVAAVHLGKGDGLFGGPGSLGVQPPIGSWSIANIDERGGADLIESHRGKYGLTVWSVVNGQLTTTSDTPVPGFVPQLIRGASDLNGDGHVDFLISPSAKELVTWFGSGSSLKFTEGPKLTLTQDAALLKLIDVNGDGFSDVVGHGASGLSVWLGRGDGSFAPNVDSVTNSSPKKWVFGSFNGDAYLDVATLGESKVDLWFGHADGTMTSAGTSTLYEIKDLDLADMDRDGATDLVSISKYSSSVTIHRGLGNGQFDQGRSFSTSEVPSSLTTGDFDGDGAPDVLLVVSDGNYLQFMRGGGAGTLSGGFERFVEYLMGPDKALVVGDLVANDGKPDVFGINGNAPQLDILSSGTGGTFSNPYHRIMPSRLDSIVSADFDNDSRLDVAMTSSVQRAVIVDYFASSHSQISYSDGTAYDTLATGDVNGDGKADLVAAELGVVGARILVTQPNFNFVSSGFVDTMRPVGGLAVADLDGDGRVDLITSSGDGVFEVFRGLGNGAFQTVSSFSAANGMRDPLLADFNGDGDLDIVYATDSTSPNVGWSSIIKGLPGLNFDYPASISGSAPSRRLALIDLDADGKMDLVSSDLTLPQLAVRRGNGDGTFTDLGQQSIPVVPGSLGVGDFNNDGKSDLVVSSKDTSRTIVILNDCK